MARVASQIFGAFALALLMWQASAFAQEAGAPLGPVETLMQEKAAPSSSQVDPRVSRPADAGKPTEVWLQIYVLDVDDVNSAEQNFGASVYYEARWKSPAHKHPGPMPIFKDISHIWTPSLTIANQQMAWDSYPDFVEIAPDGTVTYRQRTWARFSQSLNLHNFPFDKQELTIHLVSANETNDEVTFLPLRNAPAGVAQHFSVPDFRVIGWMSGPAAFPSGKVEGAVAGFRLDIEVKRRPMFFLIKIVLPLVLIVMMSWIPRWIDPEQVATNIGVSATAFLTLVAYLFATNVLLPRVSYVTRMDLFILLSMLMVFIALVQTVVSTVLVRNHELRLAQDLDWWARIVYPIALVAVLLVSLVI
jgi:gamma-aminobutyric acid receptor subunit beta